MKRVPAPDEKMHKIQQSWAKVREAQRLFDKTPNYETAVDLQRAKRIFKEIKTEVFKSMEVHENKQPLFSVVQK